jgi:hypothetical protein
LIREEPVSTYIHTYILSDSLTMKDQHWFYLNLILTRHVIQEFIYKFKNFFCIILYKSFE